MNTLTLPLVRIQGDSSTKAIVLKQGPKGPLLATNDASLSGWNIYFYKTHFSVGCETIEYKDIQKLLDKLNGVKKEKQVETEEGYSKGISSFILKENIIEESKNFYIAKGGKCYSKQLYKPATRPKKIKDVFKKLVIHGQECDYSGRDIGKVKDVKQFLLDLQEYLKQK